MKMKKTWSAALVLILALVGVNLTGSPSSAHVTGNSRITLGINTPSPLHVDNRVIFNTQADGTGVYVDWTGLTTTNCASNLPDSPRFHDIHVWVRDLNSGALISEKAFAATNICNPTWQVSRYGNDEGAVKVTIMVAAGISARDVWLEWQWELYPSGNSALTYAAWTYY